MAETISVVIPALNEARSLPGLLASLNAQTRPPDEIIVADAGSTDGTVELARQAGAKVVPGGMPAAGRNLGAAAAGGSLLLFLDADVLPEPDFVERISAGFIYFQLTVATCMIAPPSPKTGDRLLSDASNLYMQTVQYIAPHAPGFCIMVRRNIHNAIRGFDETAVMAEDHDYVQRAAAFGEFAVLSNVSIPVSLRRLQKEGLVRLALKYLYCEMFALSGQPVRSMPFVYEFGNFDETQPARRFMNVTWLRQKLGRFGNPLERLKGTPAALRSLGRLQLSVDAFEQHLQELLPADLDVLRRYLRRRLALIRLNTRTTWQSSLHLLKDGRKKGQAEIIRLLDDGSESQDED